MVVVYANNIDVASGSLEEGWYFENATVKTCPQDQVVGVVLSNRSSDDREVSICGESEKSFAILCSDLVRFEFTAMSFSEPLDGSAISGVGAWQLKVVVEHSDSPRQFIVGEVPLQPRVVFCVAQLSSVHHAELGEFGVKYEWTVLRVTSVTGGLIGATALLAVG